MAIRPTRSDRGFLDNPFASQLTVHILSAVAEYELKQISDRTKAALTAAKRRGIKLGSLRKGHWQGRENARLAGSKKGAKIAGERHRADADEAYEDLMPLVIQMRTDGKSYRAIAGELNDLGHTTRRGKAWTSTQVLRIVNRLTNN